MSSITTLLPDTLLETIRARAQAYDHDNRFCQEDLNDLRESGYLTAAVPTEFGGHGLSLAELTLAQRRLAAAAPATALAVNMHLLWAGVAKILYEREDDRLNWVFEEMVAGEIFAFGISEAGNEVVLLDSFCDAVPDGEGYRISGTKIFTTLSPVWTRLGVHARTGGETPRIIAGFIRRDATPEGNPRSQDNGGEGITYRDRWNPLGMRATQSWNTRLEGAHLAGRDVVATYEPFDPSDALILAVSLAFGVLTSSVYAGIADRAIELATQAANAAQGDGVKLDDPHTASILTDAVLEHRASIDALELLASDIDAGAPRDDWSLAIAALKNRVTDEARAAVDTAIRVVGSRAFDADSELARMYRDVLAGIFHPRSARSLAREVRNTLTLDE